MLYSAGITSRLVRSPPAPKITMAQGSAGRARRRGGESTTCTVGAIGVFLSSTALLGGVQYRRVSLQFIWLWFGVNWLLPLDVPTEAKAHGREYLFSEG